MGTDRSHPRRAFTLLELAIVMVITIVLSAVAIPRISRGAEGASLMALRNDRKVIQRAIDHYTVEHGGQPPAGSRIMEQLTQYTDLEGNTSPTPTTQHIYGPYLHKVPKLSFGDRKDQFKIATGDASDVGWIYNPTTGRVRANLVNVSVSDGL